MKADGQPSAGRWGHTTSTPRVRPDPHTAAAVWSNNRREDGSERPVAQATSQTLAQSREGGFSIRCAEATAGSADHAQGPSLPQGAKCAFALTSPPITDDTMTEEAIPNELLYGVRSIARFLEITVGQARPLIEAGIIPTFRLPGHVTLCARKSTLNANWKAMEERWSAGRGKWTDGASSAASSRSSS